MVEERERKRGMQEICLAATESSYSRVSTVYRGEGKGRKPTWARPESRIEFND